MTTPSGKAGTLTGMTSPGCTAALGAEEAYIRSPNTFPEYSSASRRAGFPDRLAPLRAPFRFPTAFLPLSPQPSPTRALLNTRH
ncbi:hypothetical protein [Streptomyces albidochromogenes]|uniref:Uncharacterized protein n=1 Tax=Streptomyces albidochromogenes TaxID=329524 RepID=A0ABW6FK43_9ACTN